MCGRTRAADVGAHVRREVAAGAGADRLGERHRNAQRPHGIRFGLLLPRHREHAPVLAGLHQAGGDDRGRSAHRAGGVHADQRLAGRAHGVGHEQFGHHHALEEVGRLADHHGVDVVERRTESASALSMASRTRPFIDTSWRLATYFVCPVPSTAASCPAISVLHHGDQILLQRRPAGGMRQHPLRRSIPDVLRRKADPLQAGREHRVGGQRPARRVHLRRRRQPDGLGQDQVLVGERRVDLGDLDRADVTARRGLRRRRRRR